MLQLGVYMYSTRDGQVALLQGQAETDCPMLTSSNPLLVL
jgi:hypothetical protein